MPRRKMLSMLQYQLLVDEQLWKMDSITDLKSSRMDPFLLGFVVLGAVALIGFAAEQWKWSKAIAVMCAIALIAEAIVIAFRSS